MSSVHLVKTVLAFCGIGNSHTSSLKSQPIIMFKRDFVIAQKVEENSKGGFVSPIYWQREEDLMDDREGEAFPHELPPGELSGKNDDLVKELAQNIALDLQWSQQRVHILEKELAYWRGRESELKERYASLVTEEQPLKGVRQKLEVLEKEMAAFQDYMNRLIEQKEADRELAGDQSSGSFVEDSEYVMKRGLLKSALERMLEESVQDTLFEERLVKMERDWQVDSELAQLKKERENGQGD